MADLSITQIPAIEIKIPKTSVGIYLRNKA